MAPHHDGTVDVDADAAAVSWPGAAGDGVWSAVRSALLGRADPAGDGRTAGERSEARNIAQVSVGRHAVDPQVRHRVALRFLGRDGRRTEVTYGALGAAVARFADVVVAAGLRPGDMVATLLGRVPEVHVAVLGTLWAGGVACPLFAAFGPEPLQQRLAIGRARMLVTTESLYRRRVRNLLDALPDLETVLIVGDDGAPLDGPPTADRVQLLDLRAGLVAADPVRPAAPVGADSPALVHFTSGTTGTPKGAVLVHDAVVAQWATATSTLALRPGDVFWCTADPGWVTGTSYGIIAPLAVGATVVVDEAGFDAARWYGVLEDERVDVWYTAPTALRLLMRAGSALAADRRFGHVRHVASVGEPLNAEVVRWAQVVLGLEVHDTWWQTETGAIMVANPPGRAVEPGSMGVAVPGVVAAVGDPSTTGPTEGELLLGAPWPSMFRAYLGEPDRYDRAFRDGWYRTGDLVRRDADGRLWFVGRADDVISSSGHLIGPFEVESVLLEHPSVAEAGVVGLPDPVAGEAVTAFVTLVAGVAPSDDLVRELVALTRARLGSAVAPRRIEIVDDLPHTRSGKVMRRLLRARELGEPEGDVSTLEPSGPGARADG